MKAIYGLIIIAALFVAACSDGGNAPKRPKAIENGGVYVGDSVGNGVKYTYKNYIVVSEIPMKDQLAHGLCKEFYDDGKIQLESNYNMGEREGMITEYYETGEKYMQTPYANNRINGTQYRYKKDGTVVFEIPYENGMPIPGIKEHDGSGRLMEQPTLVFTRKGANLEMKLSDDNKSAEFYQIVGGKVLKMPCENGVGKLIIKNAIEKGELHVRATYKTMLGNKAAVDSTY